MELLLLCLSPTEDEVRLRVAVSAFTPWIYVVVLILWPFGFDVQVCEMVFDLLHAAAEPDD